MQWLALALLLAADSGQPVLPPGQDEAFATMLGRGATLPDGCVWSGALIDRSFVISQYTCGERLVKLTLKHESDVNAPNAIARTNRFVFFGEVPTGLRDELVTRVDLQFRNEVEWVVGHGIAARAIGRDGDAPAQPASNPAVGAVAVWLPHTSVARVQPSKIPGVTVAMTELASLADAAAVQQH